MVIMITFIINNINKYIRIATDVANLEDGDNIELMNCIRSLVYNKLYYIDSSMK